MAIEEYYSEVRMNYLQIITDESHKDNDDKRKLRKYIHWWYHFYNVENGKVIPSFRSIYVVQIQREVEEY